MQNVKDSLYITLRDRLSVFNPTRLITVNGVARPAIIVPENEAITASQMALETFHLVWREAGVLTSLEPAPWLRLNCEISYASEGTDELNSQDRGRIIGAMDEELYAICRPAKAPVQSYASGTPQVAASVIFWGLPELTDLKSEGRRLVRRALMRVYAIAEGNW